LKIDPKTFEGFNRVITGVVVPRPIAFVSTISPEGVLNVAPYSFFNVVSYNPAMVIISSSRHAGDKRKDTLANIENTGEFVVNIVVDDIAEAMNMTAAEYPAEDSEFDIAGLSPAPSDLVKPPRVAESPVNLECKLNQIIKLGEGSHEHGLVIGEVVLVHVRDDIIDGHRIDQQRLKPTGRLAGNMYCHTTDVFEMVRPSYQPDPTQSVTRVPTERYAGPWTSGDTPPCPVGGASEKTIDSGAKTKPRCRTTPGQKLRAIWRVRRVDFRVHFLRLEWMGT